jgi:hypothetical protein
MEILQLAYISLITIMCERRIIMKRTLSFLLAAVLCLTLSGGVSALAASGFNVSGITSFTVDGDPALVNRSSMSAAEPVAALEKLLNGATVMPTLTANSYEIARITTSLSGWRSASYTVYLSGSVMYVSDGGRSLAISAEGFHSLLNAFGNSFYKYRAMPTLSLTGGGKTVGPLWVSGNTYAYQKLDGKFYLPYFAQDDILNVWDASKGEWPELKFERAAGTVTVRLSEGGNNVFSGSWQDAGSYAMSHPKRFTADVSATYNHELYRGRVTYRFEVIGGNSIPIPKFTITENALYPGEMLVLRVADVAAGETISFSSDIQVNPRFFDDGAGGKIALMPIRLLTGVGDHYINLNSGGKSVSWSVKVQDKRFQIQNLTVDASTANSTINDQSANNEFEAAIAPLRPIADSTRYWDGFVWPATGVTSTEFGMIRYINGAPTSVRHAALDIANATGTPIKATAKGRVIYAGFLRLTGNTVLIEHGYGLKSWYYHMDSLNVKAGDMVAISQQIGKMGSTGFSTGPHLHFAISINDFFINPSTVIDTDLLK